MNKQVLSTEELGQLEHSNTRYRSTNIPWWIATIVILGAILTMTGAVISKVMPTMLTGSPMTQAAYVYADYMFARSLSLAVLLLLFLWLRSRQVLAGLMLLTALIQIVDITNDVMRSAFILVPGLLVFAVAFLMGAWKLFKYPHAKQK